MASVTFVDKSTAIPTTWLQAINDFFYVTFAGATTIAGIKTALGISSFAETYLDDTTPALTRATLGSTTVGDALFTTASAAAARVTLDVPSNAEAILDTLVDAKGDLIVGTAADTVARLAVGANQTLLEADSTQTTGLIWVNRPDYGQAQLTYTDTTHIKLIPFNGNKLVVNGIVCTVPDAGVSYTISGLSANTNYYVYAVATTGAISSIELSTTVPVTSTTAGNKGTQIKTGDDTRSLVGFVRANNSTQFADTDLQRFVRSWFNDGGVTCMGVLSGDVALSSAPWGALSASTFLEFLAWGNESGHADAGFNYIDTGGNSELLYSGIGLNSASTPGNSQYSVITVDSTNYYKHGSASRSDRLSVGYNYYRIIYGIGGGTTPFMSTGSGISCDIGR